MTASLGTEYVDADIEPAWTATTFYIDHDHDAIGEFVDRATADAVGATEHAVALFHAVRDGIRYDPYVVSYDPDAFRASTIVGTSSNWCVPKSILFAAAARRLGIPARLGYADVRNHLTTDKLSARLGTDVFAWHGYTELLLPDPDVRGRLRWFKLSTAFNIELCERFGVRVLEFDGSSDALMHPFDESGRRHMEYIRQRGSFDDFPLDEMLVTFAEVYGTAFGSTDRTGAAASAQAAGDEAFAP